MRYLLSLIANNKLTCVNIYNGFYDKFNDRHYLGAEEK